MVPGNPLVPVSPLVSIGVVLSVVTKEVRSAIGSKRADVLLVERSSE